MKRKMSVPVMAVLLAVPALAWAGELRIGDPAPPIEVAKWVKGSPIDVAAARDKQVLLIEFWATWCGPCIESIPHLTEMQKKFGPKGLVVVGMTSLDDRGNTLEKVEEFVGKQGAKIGYAIAFDKESKTELGKENKTETAYMKASGQEGIPTAFIVDKSGRVAWIGHPLGPIDDVVDEVLAGKFNIETAKKIGDIQRRMEGTDDLDAALKMLDEWIALKPDDFEPYAIKFRIHLDLKDKPEPEQALEVARAAVAACANKPRALISAAELFARDREKKEFNDLALQAIEQAVKLEPNNPDALSTKFSVLALLKRQDEAVVLAESAIKAMKNDAGALARFAGVLASPEMGSRYDDLAVQAINLAVQAEPDEPRHLVTKFQLLLMCKKDLKAAEETGRYLIEKAGEDAELLNAFSWNLLTDESSKGKFNALALEAAERSNRASGGKEWMVLDTVALARFENGNVQGAIEAEKKAIELCNPMDPAMQELRAALQRFEGKGGAGETKPGMETKPEAGGK